MKVKASSILKGNFISLLIWILGVAFLNLIVYLIFGEANITAYCVAFSIFGLFFRLFHFCHVLYCTLLDKDIEIQDNSNSAEEGNVTQKEGEVVASLTTKPGSTDTSFDISENTI